MISVDYALEKAAAEVRRNILKIAHLVGPERKAHPGAALSAADIVTFLHLEAMTHLDRFILSKGHGALALYAVLAYMGEIKTDEFGDVRSSRGRLQGHPVRNSTPSITLTTGSLGHGLGLGGGVALAMRLKKQAGRVFVVLGDGELQEGMIWESALVSANLQLSNIVAVVDANKYQSSGRVESVSPIEPILAKFAAFGWATRECDGHDFAALRTALMVDAPEASPLVVVARTIKGKGIKFMEGNAWHQKHLSGELLRSALAELDDA